MEVCYNKINDEEVMRMKLSKVIPFIAAAGGAAAFAVYKLRKDKKEIIKLDEGLLLDEEGETFDDMHIDEVKAPDAAEVDVDIPAFQEEEEANAQPPFVMDEETKEKIRKNVTDAISALSAVGDVHGAERPIEHQMSFADESSLAAFKETIIKRGYVVTKGENPKVAVVMHIAPADEKIMLDHVLYLYEETKKHNGTYEGWHCDPVY